MAYGILDDSYLSDIADAIRSKTGSSGAMYVSEFASAISSISGSSTVISAWLDGFIEQVSGISGGSLEWDVVLGKTITFSYNISSSFSLSIYNDTTLYDTVSLTSAVNSYSFIRLGSFALSDYLTDFVCVASVINGQATKRARPLLLVPSDYSITQNTLVDVLIIISAANVSGTTATRELTFKYRFYEPASISSYKDYEGTALSNVSSVSVSPSSISMNDGDTQQLSATVLPNDAYYLGVSWESSNPSAVSVDSNGLVSAISPASNVSVTATSLADNTISDSATITVIDSLGDDYWFVDYGTKQGSSSYYDFVDNDTFLSVKYLDYSSGSYIPYTGSLYIYDSLSATTPLFTISNNTTSWTEYVNASQATTFYIGFSSGSYWSSSTPYMPFELLLETTSIKYKYVNGVLTMRYLGVSGYVAVTGLSLDQSSATVGVDSDLTLVASITPRYATNRVVNWASSDNSIATVSDGVVSGISEGSVTITATSDDSSSIYDTCSVSVTAVVPSTWSNVSTFSSNGLGLSIGVDSSTGISYASSTQTGLIANVSVYNGTQLLSITNSTTVPPTESNLNWSEVTASSPMGNNYFINIAYSSSNSMIPLPSTTTKIRVARFIYMAAEYLFVQYQ